ncbi:SRPBCC family protein [Rhodococcus sp. IEGM 1401]|uniref:SRPBCC family protein n=1 Tax=unclassified Rhodococcus (in: high G+C Gram-positive bacteria) TaxID=192944 RepID=UPI0022B4DACA|nr:MULTISPECIES: SRPBCC family protein [unclassified Rhodococcus (in: high G+C Gram-positive bacteria)]MCZ4561321.1 SRPBCC family protein [Rhodococcus sp. IEGM 1401]MDI9921551.1 SRPBCC family protein [Rhodococcus sp. IEGM 1372]MDV8033917.1 SRPBCC family protein [Rhodococcus sp. IEGM 1414]
MILTNTLDIDASAEDVFRLINDVEKVATCVPGAAITGKDGETYLGGVKVKVGPISASYAGTIRFLEVDAETRTLTLEAKGADSHGNGDAEAQVDLAVEALGDRSRLTLNTDLVISGKIVSFGKGAIVAVSNKVLQQFAVNLGALLSGSAPAESTTPAAVKAAVASPMGGELNAMSLMPEPVRKYAPIAGIFLAGMVEGWLVSRAFGRR